MKDFAQAAQALKEGQSLIMINIIRASGSVPRSEGARLFVLSGGQNFGTVGGGLVEYQAIEKAKEKLAQGDTRAFTEDFVMNNKDAAELGMVCGGRITLYYQTFSGQPAADCFAAISRAEGQDKDSWLFIPVRPEAEAGSLACFSRSEIMACCGAIPENLAIALLTAEKPLLREQDGGKYYVESLVTQGRVLVFGGGHVAQALVPLLNRLNFKTLVFEDRPQFCTRAIFPAPTELVIGDFRAVEDKLKLQPGDYVVIMTRGHQGDMEVLGQVLRRPLRYIGMMGSRRKIHTVYQHLQAQGFTEEDFARVHSPIGIEINSETPDEIAVSIAAELIMVKNKEI